MDHNHYEILGVTPRASRSEVQEAYRSLAKVYHPDVHGSATRTVQDRMQAAMGQINEAYRVLSDSALRQEYDRSLTEALRSRSRQQRPASPVRHRQGDECELCGSTPVRYVCLSQLTGLLITRRVRQIEAGLCRTCGLEVFRRMTSRTLVTGWWGLISFFANALAILRNIDEWNDLRRLDRPRRRTDAEILTPLSSPLPQGRPLWQRPGFLAFFGAVTILVAFAYADAQSTTNPSPTQSSPPSTSSTPSASTAPDWAVGSCVRFSGDQGEPVPCADAHDAVVVRETRPEQCPWYYWPEQGISTPLSFGGTGGTPASCVAPSTSAPVMDYSMGSCLREVASGLIPVPCTTRYDFFIEDIVGDPQHCPDYYLEEGSQTLCLRS